MKLLVVLAVCAVAAANSDEDVFRSVMGVLKTCSDDNVALCLKEKALRYVENVSNSRELNLIDGVSLIGQGSPRSARSFEPLPDEPRARENQVDLRLLDGVADFLENFVIQIRLPKGAIESAKRSLEEGRGKKKKLKQLLPILALLQLKIQSLIPVFLGIIAFAAVKGLMLAKAALLASGLILLKKLLSKNDHHESYEVVAHPHHEEHFSHSSGGGGGGHGGWGRSAPDAQNLAYNAYLH
ncbi:uncharacterized protein LOC114253070 [Bombyx mandarina]|uniref:Uncharacterized protein LOC114253070 n=1 Tax=Bombyx mandarina TaxID=7092 RepID=A0A6J2KNA7_BOMMA|nr:uncharacterized protein LOC114253070 [Bombyx mandarina]